VLVADDDPNALDIACVTLELAGAQVTCTTAADDALQLLVSAEPPYHVVIADYHWEHDPEHDGVWLIGQVRRLRGARARTPAIAYTADPTFTTAHDLASAGFDGRLVKATAPPVLVDQVARVVGR
jgi:CheY-like chemotaxis protein